MPAAAEEKRRAPGMGKPAPAAVSRGAGSGGPGQRGAGAKPVFRPKTIAESIENNYPEIVLSVFSAAERLKDMPAGGPAGPEYAMDVFGS